MGNIETGGLKKFGWNNELKLDDSRKKDIQEAYGRYYERRRKERIKRNILYLLAIVFILITGFLIYRTFI